MRPTAPRVEPPAAPRRRWPWGRIGVGAAALIIGFSLGVWAPWSGTGLGTAEPLAADDLPETIVPEPPEEFSQPPAQQDEPFVVPPDGFDTPEEFFDQLPEDFLDQIPPDFLDQLPEDFFDGLPGATTESRALIDFGELPDGYQARSNVFSQANDRASQRVRLLGPDGAVDVQAIRGPEVALPAAGEPFSVGGVQGRLVTSDEATTISWLAEDDLLITVEAGSDVDVATLAAIARAVEVSE